MGLYTVIDHRAFKTLHLIAGEFQSYAPIGNVSNGRIQLDGSRIGVEELSASYKIINKWMGRVYIYTWMWTLHDKGPEEDLVIKCEFSVKMKTGRQVRFFSKSHAPLVEWLNQDKRIKELCNSIDYELLELRYSSREQRWRVEMRPNYGDFIWILLPPVKYARKPKPQEIQDTMSLIKRLAKLIKKEERGV